MATATLYEPAAASTTKSTLDDEPLYEVVDGQVVEPAPIAANAIHLASVLLGWIAHFVRVAKLGRTEGEMLYILDAASGSRRRPDLSFVSYDRWPRTTPVPSDAGWPAVPDLAVEVVSPSNSATEFKRKIREYFAAGVRLVWVVYPEEFQVESYDSPTSVRILDRSQTLDGADVLRGFQLALTELFEDVTA